jgi:23S rRNA (uracil1939-C5)-methyltransferase
MLDPVAGRRVFDVYGGAGLIGLALAKRGARAIIVEGNPASIADARATAEAEKIKIAARRGRAEDVVPRLLAQGTRAQDVVLDPPREGCHPRLIQALGRLEPERIVYVSCDPESLARDLVALEEQGFATTEVVPIDMFPHAYHVEAVASLRRRA